MKTELEINYWPREWETKCTSGNSLKTASSAAALHLSILEEDDGDAPKQETWMNLMIPPCSFEICNDTIWISNIRSNLEIPDITIIKK